jgi:hypothetical protein
MAKNKNKDDDKPVEEVEPVIETPPVSDPKAAKISSKQFVKSLQKELKGIDKNVFIAFIKNTPMVETEEFYNEKWNKTYKRQ